MGATTSAQATLDALSDPVLVIAPDGRVQLVNAATARLLGEDAESLVGRPAAELFPERLRRVDELDVVAWLQSRANDTVTPIRAPLLRPDGVEISQVLQVTTTSAEDVGTVTILVLRSPGDGPDELELDPSKRGSSSPTVESRYGLVFDAVPVGVLHFDAVGRVTACNEVFVAQMGSSRQLITGIDMRTLPNEGVVAAVNEALAGRLGLFEGEYVSATAGRTRQLRATFSPVVRDGEVLGGVGIIDDITDRRQIEERLAQGERMASLGRLAAGVAHEINNPLAYVRTSLDIARRRLAQFRDTGDETFLQGIDDGIGRAYDGVERVRVIASDLKTFSRGDDGSWLPVDMARVLDTAINLARAEIGDVATIETDVTDAPFVMGSETRFVQVLVNLLVNAAQAIDQTGEGDDRIRVRVHVRDERVIIDVEDTGMGMPPELVPRVFEPFWTSKPRGAGTGLGLSICHGIVTAAGGEIRVLHTAPSEGTTVRVELPASPRRSSAPSHPEPDRSEPGSTRPRVLVIDDELRLAKTLALGLADRYHIDVAENGKAGLEALRAAYDGAPYDLVLCDLMMPDMSGMDLYDVVEEEAPEVAKRFVFMTGGAFTDRARKFLAEHTIDRLEKPFALEDVERLVAAAVDG